MGHKVYVLMSLQKDLFDKACCLNIKLNNLPGFPFQVLDSKDSSIKKCRSLNREPVVIRTFVFFYKELYYYY